jgi:hypothetical protein
MTRGRIASITIQNLILTRSGRNRHRVKRVGKYQ